MANATMETDPTNPMMFDVNGSRAKYENGEHLPQDLSLEQVKKWVSVYATYFNADLSVNQGRRVLKDLCAEEPNINMIAMAVQMVGLRYVMEPLKKHPKDFFSHGRLKIQLKDESGRPMNSQIGTDRRKLYRAIGEKIPEALVKYTEILEQQKEELMEKKKQMEALRAEQMGQQPGVPGQEEEPVDASSKKKNKKKKK